VRRRGFLGGLVALAAVPFAAKQAEACPEVIAAGTPQRLVFHPKAYSYVVTDAWPTDGGLIQKGDTITIGGEYNALGISGWRRG
jgi:hypothetical protein